MTKVIFKPNYNYNDFFSAASKLELINVNPMRASRGLKWESKMYKKRSISNFSTLISRDNWTFHYQKTLCVIYTYITPIRVTILCVVELPGVLNDQIFKKALFRFQTANWYLLSVLWLIINFPRKKK